MNEGGSPTVDPTAYVAPTATLSGDVRVGPDCRVLFGAVLTAECGPGEIGEGIILMENAVLHGTRRDPCDWAAGCWSDPTSYLSGCQVEDEVFLATGSRVLDGARIGTRVNGLVHLRTVLPPDSMVPIGWVAVGDPLRILPADDHDGIWAAQKALQWGRACACAAAGKECFGKSGRRQRAPPALLRQLCVHRIGGRTAQFPSSSCALPKTRVVAYF